MRRRRLHTKKKMTPLLSRQLKGRKIRCWELAASTPQPPAVCNDSKRPPDVDLSFMLLLYGRPLRIITYCWSLGGAGRQLIGHYFVAVELAAE